ncbi:MAG: type II secretion system F family protein [Defluviitaleaceae bacterium]|nr:type II secretion system F family protein [Defluviitaleaceae bacterium]MCL2238695.1 type II secretion system F family protein [Defluviitaleaceae bacterium]
MLTPPRSKDKAPAVSIWHRDIGDLFSGGRAKVKPGELAVFCRKLGFMLGAGVVLNEALPLIAAQTKGRVLKQAIPDVHRRIMQGESFAGAMKAAKVFPVFMCGFAGIGEMTAQLPMVCVQLADYYEKQAQSEDELAAALVYPAAVTAMMLGVMVMAVVVVLPGYAQVFDHSGVALPALTRWLLGASHFLSAHRLALGICLFAVGVATVIFLRGAKGRGLLSVAQLRLSVFRQRANLRLVQSLSLMLNAGQSVSGAVPVCAEVVDNERVKGDFAGIHTALSAGRSFWAALAEVPYIDPLFVGLARVGEETGRLPQTMAQCQDYFSQAYSRTLRRLNKLVEPVITLVLGLLLAMVMLAIVLPTFEMATVV